MFSMTVLFLLSTTIYLTKDKIVNAIDNIKELISVISTQYESKAMICYVTVKTIIEYEKKKLETYLKNINTRKLNKDVYEITYYIGKNKYKILTSVKRGPSLISKIMNENEEDITEAILPYFGPRGLFHYSQIITPRLLDLKKLTIVKTCGQKVTFEENDIVSYLTYIN